ncbi:MAG: hypothetical protein ACU837_15965 [Gammaproteobacteria bacterium]
MKRHDLVVQFAPKLRHGQIDPCISMAEKALKKLPVSPFHKVIELEFENEREEVAEYFDAFYTRVSKQFSPAAIYTETNGFAINPDEWYFDLFGYDTYHGHENYDWLANPNAESNSSRTLYGMEELQEVYASGAFYNNAFNSESELCSLIVVLKFQKLIRESLKLLQHANCPILATAHDYDLISEFHVAGASIRV